MSFDFSTLITDRSQSDVETARELTTRVENGLATAEEIARWNLAAEKGAYNYTDLNRVIAAMDDINERLTAAGYVTGYQRIAVPHQEAGGRLPSGYTELQYIESTGTQYIDTGVTPNQDTQIILDYRPTAAATVAVFGSRAGVGNAAFALWIVNATSIEDDYASDRDTISVSNLLERTLVVKDANILDYGDTTREHAEVVFSNQYPIALFGINSAGTVDSRRVSARLYSCSIRTGTDERDYIPCLAPDGSVGLYDLVGKSFYKNSGTGSFVAGPKLVTLPSGYKQLEYIESTGTQYIDTGVTPNQDTALAGSFMVKSTANAAAGTGFIPYGAAYKYNSQAFELYTTSGQFEINYDGQVNFIGTVQMDQKIHVNHDKNIVSIILQDGTSVNTAFTYQNFTAPYTLTLFAINRRSTVCGLLRLYSCKIYDNGTLVRDFVPCKNDSNEIGLFDLSRGVFYGNDGTGSFVAGPEVQPVPDPEPEPVLEPYTWYESDVPTSSLLSAYLTNVGNLKSTLTLPTGTPAVPDDMEGLTQTEANHIEMILDTINIYLISLQEIFPRSGATICGSPSFYFIN